MVLASIYLHPGFEPKVKLVIYLRNNCSGSYQRWSWWFTLASSAMVLREHLPRLGIRTPDLLSLSPKTKGFHQFGHTLIIKNNKVRNNELKHHCLKKKLLWAAFQLSFLYSGTSESRKRLTNSTSRCFPSYILMTLLMYFIFQGVPYRTFLLYLPRFACHFYLAVSFSEGADVREGWILLKT